MKHYEEPSIEILKFTVADVITLSDFDENAGEEDEFGSEE